jgi:uncharacterized protein YraI
MITSVAELNAARAAGGAFVDSPDGLHLRAAPSLAFDMPILTTMPDGAAFKLTGEHRVGFVEGTFNGQAGWAFNEFLAMSGVSPGDRVATVVAAEGLNLRGEPRLDGQALTLMPNGSTLTLTGDSRLGFLQGSFNGQVGWAFGEYLDASPEGNETEIEGTGLKLAQAMHDAHMEITQGPRQGPTHWECDCYDFSCNVGTPIFSVAAGEVVESTATNAVYRPNVVVVETRFGKILYAHLSQRNVSVGDHVEPTTLLGLSGSENGGHLHLGLKGGVSPMSLSLTQILARVGFNLRSFPVRHGVIIPD